MLNISRQSVSRGLRSDSDYLDIQKIARISEVAPRIFDIKSDVISRLIEKFYPDYRTSLKRNEVSTLVNLSIDSDFYFCCTRIPYYMSVYKKLFFDLSLYIREHSQKKLYFAFPDPDTLRYSRDRIIKWIGHDGAVNNAFEIVCPSIEVFPFSVCGYHGKKPAVYFCDGDGFIRQNENNSRWIVNFIERYVEQNKKRIKALKQAPAH